MQTEQSISQTELNLIESPTRPPLHEEKATIERDKLFGDSKREQELKQTIHTAIKFFIWFIVSIGCLLALSRAIHFIIPENWFWLNPNQLLNLDTIAKYLISSAVGGLFIKYINKGVEDK
jgi:hypothetical protein